MEKSTFIVGKTRVFIGDIQIGSIFGSVSDFSYEIVFQAVSGEKRQKVHNVSFEDSKKYFRMMVPVAARDLLQFKKG